jgi:hypothetical protein
VLLIAVLIGLRVAAPHPHSSDSGTSVSGGLLMATE